jgi:flagellar motility protein MotE (MotC chaperone)
MAMNGTKLGELLMDADIITKRQLAKAVQKQVNGDKRKLGEILVEMGYVNVADLTEVMMEQANRAKSESEKGKRDRLLQKQIIKSKSKSKKSKPEPVVEKVVVQPTELSEDKILGTKFTLSIQTMIAAGTGLASLIGMWYALQADIQEAKELPRIDIEEIYKDEYPSRPEGHNWPRSKEQYNQQVGDLQDEMDDAHETIEEMKEAIKELQKDIKDLERRKKDKK